MGWSGWLAAASALARAAKKIFGSTFCRFRVVFFGMVFSLFFDVLEVPDHFWFFEFSMKKKIGLRNFFENFGLVDHL